MATRPEGAEKVSQMNLHFIMVLALSEECCSGRILNGKDSSISCFKYESEQPICAYGSDYDELFGLSICQVLV